MNKQVLENLKTFSSWKPDKKAISWTKKFLSDNIKNNKHFIWTTTNYSIEFKENSKDAIIKDINFNHQSDPKESFENLSRIIKVLEKINYNIIIDEQMVINLDQKTRLVNKQIIDKNIFIPVAEYDTLN